MSRNNLYDSQKLGENRDRKYSTIIELAIITYEDENKVVFKALDGETYTAWKNNQQFKELIEELKTGKETSVYVTQKRNLKGDKPYKNIIKSIF